VRLYFAEPDDAAPGDRVFTVELQGRTVLRDFDVVEAAGGPRRTVVREFPGVKVKDLLEVRLAPSRASSIPAPLLCGLEIRAE